MQRKIKKSPRPVLLCLILLMLTTLLTASLSGLSPMQTAFFQTEPQEALSCTGSDTALYVPGGMGFGVRLSTKGVLVVGFSRPSQGGACPAEKAGLSTKDVIEKINGRTVNTAAEVIGCIESCGGKPVTLSVNRGGEALTVSFTPEKDQSGLYKAGIWVRDSTAGIGTVTLIEPESGRFVGLGHGICDTDTGVLMPLLKGNVYDISVVAVRKGKAGAPGELKGYFSPSLSGILLKNTDCGVSGRFSSLDKASLHEAMPLARREEVTVGKASIFCTLTDGVTTEYSVNITKIANPDGKTKNFVIEVDDARLLSETGGIVQGMSGSPVIQNGKIVGAVTHVMVNDPTKGYGIFIDNMINVMGES